MSKKFRLKAILLVLMISFCTIISACSGGNKDYKVNIYEDDIAYITLFAYSGKDESNWGLINLGHAFLSIENISNNPITIYNISINMFIFISFFINFTIF